jgi:hypothetical protein
MKKLLSVLFMAFLAVSAFATVNVESEIGLSVYHDGSCERVGTLRYIVTNETDFQSASTTSPIYIKIRLTDAAVLCHDLDGVDDAADNVNWVSVEVDGNAATGWEADEVKIRGGAGWDYIEVRITVGPGDQAAGTYPSTAAQAWFRFGSTLDMAGNPITLQVWQHDAPDTALARTVEGVPLCFNYTGRVNGVDAFQENDINSVVMETYQGSLDGSPLGISYSPANPPIAYGGDENANNWTLVVDGKGAFSAQTVYLCDCYTSVTADQTTTTTCHCVYRYGSIDFTGAGGLTVALQETVVGMLPAGSIIEMTVVDSQGNPLSTIADGVYLVNGTGGELTANTADSGLAIGNFTMVGATAVNYLTANQSAEDDGTCPSGLLLCGTAGTYYTSYTWDVTAASTSTTNDGLLTLGNVQVARESCDSAIDAYIKVTWYPYPCGAGGSYVLSDYPIHFVDCPVPGTLPTYKATAYEYFTYLPSFEWWSGLAVTNATYFYDDVTAQGFDNQDITATLYFIEEDGAIYELDGGTIPASGIATYLLSGLPTAPTLVSGTDSAFGDERFWVVVKAESTNEYTNPSNKIFIDGFGMLGDGTQAQGFLPRVWNDIWTFSPWN